MSGNQNLREVTSVKKRHRLTHSIADEMNKIYADASKSKKIEEACEKVFNACDICTSSGRPSHSNNISLSHINEAFNEELQEDFTMVYIREQKYFVLNIVDAGTRYGERINARSSNAMHMMEIMESGWIYHHGAPKLIGADPEFCKPFFERFLKAHGIELKPRPARASYNNGLVERNNGVFKAVINSISKEKTDSSAADIVARVSFLTNMFHGNYILSAFQLARGYAPSILGIPSTVVTEDLLAAHI